MLLRNGMDVKDIRLDRLEGFDARSRKFPVIRSLSQLPLKSNMWECKVHLDQGTEGACVGAGIGHELLASPNPASASIVTMKYAREKIYWPAQKADQYPGGSYPGATPFYEGTTVLAGVKTVKKIGWIKGYEWSFGPHDLALGVGYKGPAVIGVRWADSMYKPDQNGFIWPSKGVFSGGHCLIVRGINVTHKYYVLRNSWGESWGIKGDCYITFEEMEALLDNQGEAVFFIGRSDNV